MYSLTERQLNLNLEKDRKHRISELQQLLKYQLYERSQAIEKFIELHGDGVDPEDRNNVRMFREKWEELYKKYQQANDIEGTSKRIPNSN